MSDFPTDLFRVPPMVGRITAATAIIRLVSALDIPGSFQTTVELSGPGLATANIVTVTESNAAVTINLSDLAAGSEYAYRVKWKPGGTWYTEDEWRTFSTRPATGSSFSVAFVSDAHWGQPNNGTGPTEPRGIEAQRCMDVLASFGPSLIFDLGDSAHMGDVHSSAAAESRYETMRRAVETLSNCGMYSLVLGNHEDEAGFKQNGVSPVVQPWNGLDVGDYRQTWGTAARQKFLPCSTNAEGNYYAVEWGDALFIALDPFRYTNTGEHTLPHDPEEWSLGTAQATWLMNVLDSDQHKWKILLLHHLVGGTMLDEEGVEHAAGGVYPAYGRGNAGQADIDGTCQAWLHNICVEYGVQLVITGHNHVYCHSIADGVHYVECPRPTHLNAYYNAADWQTYYGSLLENGDGHVEALRNVLGGLLLDVTPDYLSLECWRTGWGMLKTGGRTWNECYSGEVCTGAESDHVHVSEPPMLVDGARTTDGAEIPDWFTAPEGDDYYDGEPPNNTSVGLVDFPNGVCVVDYVPELIDSITIE